MRDKRKNSPAERGIIPFLAAAMILVAGCAADGGRGEATQAHTTPEATSEETTIGEEGMLEVRPIDSGSSGQGAAQPNAIVAASIESLAAALGPNPDLRRATQGTEDTTGGEGGEVYVAVFWGEKNTGGYAVEIESASLEGERVEISLSLQNPPEGAIVTQALTYPYAISAIENLDAANKDFVLTDESGRELAWPVETA